MRSALLRETEHLSPVQALFVTALLAVSGSSERVRRIAADVFQRAALPAVWGYLYRHTGTRPSWLRLASITHEATGRFLNEWPTRASLSVESMMSALESCTRSVDSRSVAMPPVTPVHGPLGVLTLLAFSERMQLMTAMRAALSPAELDALHGAVEGGRREALVPHIPDTAAANAVERLESILLSAAMYTLGIPNDTSGSGIAA
ncbi:hypothetical protein [Gemmatimonas sp.]|uniref:hypothetical protein n=1 Tax=Gemmatimonas sp. TaxID=1962908 RepID=UPI003DA4DF03